MALLVGCNATASPIEKPVVRPLAAAGPGVTDTSTVVQFTLRFGAASSHYADVEAIYPTAGRSAVEVLMPVWTPGSYLVREYARNVEDVRASAPDGRHRPVTKVAKNRWRITVKDDDSVVLSYRVYGRERTVRTNFIDADHAVIVPAATFMGDVDALDRPYRLVVQPRAEWPDVAVALPRRRGWPGAGRVYVAEDFDALVDAPLVMGRLDRRPFTIRGVKHELVTLGGGDEWDAARAAADTERLARAVVQFWGGAMPYDRYLFLNVLNEGRGGLEHRASTLMMSSRWLTQSERDYARWRGLVTHEFFHAWNGKRLRPASLGPFDYDSENYVRTLWFVEGFTSYYDVLLRYRAGLMSAEDFLGELSQEIERLEATPGQRVQSLDDASYDAWIKAYRANENSTNSSVSYYNKGALLAWVLDARIRKSTVGKASLDTVMRRAYERFSGDRGYQRDDIVALVREVGGSRVADWLDEAARSAHVLDYRPALNWYGLRFKPADRWPTDDSPESRATRRKQAWLGIVAKPEGGRLFVGEVVRNSPAMAAGVNVEDELLGLGGFRISQWPDQVRRFEPGARLSLLVARRGALRSLTVTVGRRPRARWPLEPDPRASATTVARRRAWLRR